MANDNCLGFLREARALLVEEQEKGGDTRELKITIANIDTAILWRQWDINLKTPIKNECSNHPGMKPGRIEPDQPWPR